MTTSVEITVIKLACTNLAGTLFFCIQYSGGGMKWNINKKMTMKIEVVGVQPPYPPPTPLKNDATCLNYSIKNKNFMLV